MGQTGFCENLRFPAVFCENLRFLRFSAKICAPEMLQFPGKAKISKNLRKSAKNCESCAFVPFSLSLLFPPDIGQDMGMSLRQSRNTRPLSTKLEGWAKDLT